MIPSPGARPVEVQMRDLSVNGISFFSSMPLPTRQAIRVIDGDIEAVAAVVACRQRDGGCTVHAELLTILMQSGVGVFVSQVA